MPAYGGAIAQNVYYAQSDLCDANVNTTSGVPTRDIDPKTGKMSPWPSPYILMVDRGDCTFVKKVRTLQQHLCVVAKLHDAGRGVCESPSVLIHFFISSST